MGINSAFKGLKVTNLQQR